MSPDSLAAGYRLVAELLLYPEARDPARVSTLWPALAGAPAAVCAPLEGFLAAPGAVSCDEYVQVLELSPPCPLYAGAYLFEEPTTCRGAGTSGRNRYMLELRNLYRHFGLEVGGGELPDFLPLMVDFLWLSLARPERDGIGLRRRLVEVYVAPALEPLRARLERYESPYAALVAALTALVDADRERMADGPLWEPPAEPRALPVAQEAAQ